MCLLSYVLVIYYKNLSFAAVGSITLLSNRIGDIIILLNIGVIICKGNRNFIIKEEYILIPQTLLFIAGCSKKSTIPNFSLTTSCYSSTNSCFSLDPFLHLINSRWIPSDSNSKLASPTNMYINNNIFIFILIITLIYCWMC